MASIVYNSFLADALSGNCNTTHTYKGMLVGPGYSESRSAHSKRSSITNEVTGSGYTSGGVSVTLFVATDNTNNKMTLTIGSATFSAVTVTSRKLIVYRSRGGASSADELVCCVDNGTDLVSNGTSQTWAASTWEIPLPAPV